jgi:diadenosine tetraphosphatase ApaH/serine/threonine PP2A family protein phosphatase
MPAAPHFRCIGRDLFLLAALAGCAHAPAGSLVFGVLGDAPYTAAEVQRLDTLIDDMNREERLDFVVHVGDIGAGSATCTDKWLEARKRQFARLKSKFVLVPGDNEWVDCKDQLGRLAAWRRYFCAPALALEVQPGEYCEHMRWEARGFLFITLNVQGSNNNIRNRAEHARRMSAVLAWLDESALLARKRGATLVAFMQANPFITLPHDGYAELRERFHKIGAAMPGRLILVHGDTHVYHDDEPIPGMRRLEVWGSPIVSWIKAEADVSGELRFGFPRFR